MNALPCQSDIGAKELDRIADEAKREEAVMARANELAAEYRQDIERVSDALSDISVGIGWYRHDPRGMRVHPLAKRFLTLIQTGVLDAELARMLRKAVDDAICEQAETDARKEIEPKGWWP